MRELTVYFCPQCGRYGYYQLVKNTVCPNCDIKMRQLNMSYPRFTKLNREERDNLIIREVLANYTSVTRRLIMADRLHNYRATIASLTSHVEEVDAENKGLKDENQELNNTVTWMHQMIWDLLNKNKALERQLSELTPKPSKTDFQKTD